ncbi:hypothetical protein PPBDW_II0694 [Photobacterium kishitanii]|nr:hypothetical protein PPBDW_II0694 [Photobacterium kishitanii]
MVLLLHDDIKSYLIFYNFFMWIELFLIKNFTGNSFYVKI